MPSYWGRKWHCDSAAFKLFFLLVFFFSTRPWEQTAIQYLISTALPETIGNRALVFDTVGSQLFSIYSSTPSHATPCVDLTVDAFGTCVSCM